MGRRKVASPAKPHSRKKSAARDRAAMTPDEAWAAELRERLLGGEHPFQLDATLDPSIFISILAGRGGGKSTALIVRALLKMIERKPGEPPARIAYIASSRPNARKLNWDPLKTLIDKLGERESFEFYETQMVCVCKRTGATYEFGGAENRKEVDKYRGQPFNEVQVDETQAHDPTLLEYLLDEAIGPRLGERDGCIVLAGTPGDVLVGFFYEVTRPGNSEDMLHRPYRERPEGWDGYSSHKWTLPDVLALPGAAKRYPALVKNWERALRVKKAKGWTDDNPKWRREYLAEWCANHTTMMYWYQPHLDGGALFNRWEPYNPRELAGVAAMEAGIAALPEEHNDWLFGYGIDLGARDPFALNVLAFSPTDLLRRYFHVFCFEQRRITPRAIAELLIGPDAVARALRGEVYTPGGLFGLTDWPVAIVADLAGLGETIILGLQQDYGIRIKAASKADKPGAITVVNGDLVDGRMFIIGGSLLEEQMAGLQWKPDEYGHPREDKAAHNHSADSWTYVRTEVNAMFSGAGAGDGDENQKAGDLTPRARPGAKAAPSENTDRWGNPSPQRERRGEFAALLQKNDFRHNRGW